MKYSEMKLVTNPEAKFRYSLRATTINSGWFRHTCNNINIAQVKRRTDAA